MKSFAFSLLMLVSSIAFSQTANDIIRQSEEKFRGTSSHGIIEIKIVRPTWERIMTATTWNQGSENSMILISAPARDAGTVFLKKDREIWNYLPTVNRTIKMPPSMLAQSWMGSDFNNDDLVKESSMISDYTHQLLREELLRGKQCYVIESTPNDDAPVVWGKLVSWVTKDQLLQWKTEFYDEEGVLVQKMEGFDAREFDGRILPARFRMTPMDEDENYTEMEYKMLEFDTEYNAQFFSVQNMKRIKP